MKYVLTEVYVLKGVKDLLLFWVLDGDDDVDVIGVVLFVELAVGDYRVERRLFYGVHHEFFVRGLLICD